MLTECFLSRAGGTERFRNVLESPDLSSNDKDRSSTQRNHVFTPN